MPKNLDVVMRSPQLEKSLLEYCMQIENSSGSWWADKVPGSNTSRLDLFLEFRLRYQGKRSVASLHQDTKIKPFKGVNVGVPIEQVMGEFLNPTFISNTHDLEPMVQAYDEKTDEVDETLTTFHDNYQRSWYLGKRQLLEQSNREVLTVGGVFHKWYWTSLWKQREVTLYVFAHPATGPIMVPNEQGEMDFMPADPNMPEDKWPVGPDGVKLRIQKLPSIARDQILEGPKLSIRPYESIGFPAGETRLDPNDWDYLYDKFTVSPFWFLGREGDPFDGKLQNLDKLYQHYQINPDDVAQKPDKKLTEPIPLIEYHMKFPVTASKRPVEIVALVAEEPRLLLGWRPSPFARRPYFNRQVRTQKDSPLGEGIPGTVWSLRNACDASLCQDLDAGNLYNHPPGLLNVLSRVEDEEYEEMGPGINWLVTGDPRQAFAYPQIPASTRNPIERENYIISMVQRIWGVTDLNMNAPTSSLSPNVATATGTMAILNQGNIKFGHLTKRLSESDSKEYDFIHEMFRNMMANERIVSVKGRPVTISPKDREQFFREGIAMRAVGNGITTNPSLRKQTLANIYMMFQQNPFVGGDLENLKKLTEMILESDGVRLNIKDTEELQFMNLVKQLMQIPAGQQILTQAVGQAAQVAQQQMAMQGGKPQGGGNGVQPAVQA